VAASRRLTEICANGVDPKQALALRPDDPGAINRTTLAHSRSRLGDVAAHQRHAIFL
jgi:hypothetical protein